MHVRVLTIVLFTMGDDSKAVQDDIQVPAAGSAICVVLYVLLYLLFLLHKFSYFRMS